MDCSFDDRPLSLWNCGRFCVPLSGNMDDMTTSKVRAYVLEDDLSSLPQPRSTPEPATWAIAQ
jgi:hypothetical protein